MAKLVKVSELVKADEPKRMVQLVKVTKQLVLSSQTGENYLSKQNTEKGQRYFLKCLQKSLIN